MPIAGSSTRTNAAFGRCTALVPSLVEPTARLATWYGRPDRLRAKTRRAATRPRSARRSPRCRRCVVHTLPPPRPGIVLAHEPLQEARRAVARVWGWAHQRKVACRVGGTEVLSDGGRVPAHRRPRVTRPVLGEAQLQDRLEQWVSLGHKPVSGPSAEVPARIDGHSEVATGDRLCDGVGKRRRFRLPRLLANCAVQRGHESSDGGSTTACRTVARSWRVRSSK